MLPPMAAAFSWSFLATASFFDMSAFSVPEPVMVRLLPLPTVMPFSAVRRWEQTTVGRRGQDYEEWKQLHVEHVFRRMEQLHPGFRAAVDHLWASSPLTIRDYYGQPEGALYGVSKDCHDMMRSQLPIWTKVKNLMLTGQNVNLHGICGVPLTAVNTVEALIGQGKLVEKINILNKEI